MSRARRAAHHAAGGLGTGAVFVLAMVAAVLLHLNVPCARRIAVAQVGSLLRPTFKGTIELLGLDRLRLTGVDGLHARIVDPDGVTVIVAQGVSARISAWAVVRSALFGSEDIDVALSRVRIDHVDLNLDIAPDGVLRLVHAIEPRTVSVGAAGGRGVHLALPDVEVNHAWIHGPVGGTPLIDVETLALRAAVFFQNKRATVDVAHVAFAARGLPQGLNPVGEVEAHLKVPSSSGKDIGAEATFLGVLGTIPVTFRGRMDGPHVEGTLDVPAVLSQQMRAVVPDAPLFQTLGVHLLAHGDLPTIEAVARLSVGEGSVDATAKLLLSDEAPSGAVHLEAARIDARAFDEKAPSSDLGVVADVAFAGKPRAPVNGTFTVSIPRGKLADQVVPHATVHGDFTVDPKALGGAKTVHATGAVAEEGAPLDFTVDMRPTPSRDAAPGGAGPAPGAPVRETVSFTGSSTVPNLPYIRRLASLPKGHGRLDVKGTVSLPDGALDASMTAEVLELENTAGTVQSVKLVTHASGSVRAPVVQSTLTVEGARTDQVAFSHAEATMGGPLLQQTLDLVAKGSNSPDVEVHADLDGRTMTAHGLTVSAKRDDVTLRATADSVGASGGGLTADGVVIEGLGNTVWGRMKLTPSALAIRAGSKGVDLARLAKLLGLGYFVHGGQVSFDVDFDAQKAGAQGKLAVDLERLSVAELSDMSGHVDARMEGRRITGTAHAVLDKVGSVDVKDSVIEVGGAGPLKPASWRRAWGQVDLSGSVDLARLAELVPKNRLPVADLAGQLYFEATSARDSESDFTPALDLSARTNGLVLSGICPRPAAPPPAKKCVPWRSTAVDLQLDTSIDGESGFAEVALRAADKGGVLAALDVKSDDLPYATILSSNGGPVLPLLERTGLVAKLAVPRRALDKLPSVVPPLGVLGEAEATVDMTGSAVEPHVELVASGHDLRATDAPRSVAMGVQIVGQYDGNDAKVSVGLRTAKEEVLDASASVSLPVEPLLIGELDAWVASLTGKVTRFPLAALPALQDHNVRGHVSGTVSLKDLHRDARADLKVKVDDLQVGPETYAGGDAALTTDGHGMIASLHMIQPHGLLAASAKAGLRWGASITPTLDEGEPIALDLQATRFRAAALRPLVSKTLSELDGTLDGRASVVVSPKAGTATMSGVLTLDDGLIQLSSTGQEFHKAHAKLSLLPGGLIRLDDVTALGLSGKVMASGVARMNGLRLGEARLDVKIPKGHGIPLDVDGVEMGEVDGDLSVLVTSPRPKLVAVDVKVPTLHVQLPVANTHTVEALDAPANVRVGVYKGKGRMPVPVALAPPREEDDVPSEAPTELDVSVHLGQDVEVRRGTQLKVALDGNPIVKVTNDVRVSGQIVLKNGTLQVQGKRFEIEKGTVTFVGDDPSNPEAVVTADWTAPDGTRVYADFIGPLKTGKVTLRSEPALPNSEILGLILFGTSDGTSNASAQSTTASGASFASDRATEGLSQGIDQLTGVEVKTRLDTSDANNPRPELEVQIARDISLQIAFVIGNPPPGQNTDRTFATIDWRFFRNWSLATTFGDAGSSMADVVWQYRY